MLSERFHRLLYAAIQQARGRPLGPYLHQLRTWEQLGFAPRVPLREGLSRTLDSYRSLGWA
jgi:hypothetical protein